MEANLLLGTVIKKTDNALSRDIDRFGHQLGLTGMQVSIIDFVARHEAVQQLFQKDIEQEFNIRRASATSALKLMEKRDLIVRAPLAKDARLKQIVLTPAARQLETQIQAFIQNSEEQMAKALGVSDLAPLKAQLLKIQQAFQD